VFSVVEEHKESVMRVYLKHELAVEQEEYTKEDLGAVEREVDDPFLCQEALGQLHSVVRMIKRIGGDKDQIVINVMQNIMKMKPVYPTVFSRTKLKNIFCLQNILVSIIQPDFLDAVMSDFKHNLSEELRFLLQQAKDKIHLQQVKDSLWQYLISKLSRATDSESLPPDPSQPLVNWLVYVSPLADDDLASEKFQECFPVEILNKHAYAVWKFLEQL